MIDLTTEILNLENAFMERIKTFGQLSQVEQIALAAELDFFEELQRLGLTNIINKLQEDNLSVLVQIAGERLNGISSIIASELNDILELDADVILRSGQAYSQQFKSRLLKGLVAGDSISEMLKDFNIPNFKWNWNIAAMDTAISEFQATALSKVFEDSPKQKFKLTGPYDKKTRCECKAVLNNQGDGFTKEEIDKGAATKLVKEHCLKVKPESQVYNWVFRGGFNCRHYWEPVENET